MNVLFRIDRLAQREIHLHEKLGRLRLLRVEDLAATVVIARLLEELLSPLEGTRGRPGRAKLVPTVFLVANELDGRVAAQDSLVGWGCVAAAALKMVHDLHV